MMNMMILIWKELKMPKYTTKKLTQGSWVQDYSIEKLQFNWNFITIPATTKFFNSYIYIYNKKPKLKKVTVIV